MPSTRQRILKILKTRQSIDSLELARLTHVTPADVRHHLRKLAAEGLIHKTGGRLISGRGRPSQLYTLTHPESNMEGLAGRLLEILGDEPEKISELAGCFAPAAADRSLHITRRLLAAMQELSALAYRPRWEAHPGGPQIIFGNCPYAAIVAEHPQLCRMDAEILEKLLGNPVQQTVKLERNDQGTVFCRFEVG